MNHHPFLRGMGLGALAGAAIAIGLTAAPKNRSAIKRGARKAAHAVSDAMEDMADALGM